MQKYHKGSKNTQKEFAEHLSRKKAIKAKEVGKDSLYKCIIDILVSGYLKSSQIVEMCDILFHFVVLCVESDYFQHKDTY